MGRHRKFNSAKQLEDAWEAYKADCDNKMVLTHDFSSKNSEFVSKDLKRFQGRHFTRGMRVTENMLT